MKFSRIIILSAFLFVSQTVFSQINLGLKFGTNYNFNGFESDTLDLSFNNAVTVQFGGLVRVKIKKIHLQGEALLTSRKGEVFDVNSQQKINFYSFDTPIIIGYKLIDLKVVKVRLNAGLIPSWNIGKFGDLDKANYVDAFYSATGGISLDIPLFLFDLRYQGAIGDYYEVQNANQHTKLSNSLLTLSVAWKII